MSNVKEPKLDLQLSEDSDGDNTFLGFDWLHDSYAAAIIIFISLIMPRRACASEVYGSMFVCLHVCV